jgi:glycosyltransferase involved in cell wall biosynthesis
MRLGVVTTSYPRFAGDPAGGFVGEHVAALRALGHDVDVVCAAPDEPLFYRGGAPELLERSPVRAHLTAAAFTARLAASVAARARRWDAIVAHWLAPSALAALPVRLPLLAIAHGGDVHLLRRLRLLGPLLHALHARGAELVFVSSELRALAANAAPRLARWLHDEARVQPMGVLLAHFGALARAPSTPPTVVVAGRLVPVKGVDVAIAAMRRVRAPAELVIAGDGPDRGVLEAAVCRGQRVTFLGAVDTARRDALLARASAVVVPSRVLANRRSEGTPRIALEALAAGVPVVASAVGGLVELPRVQLVAPDRATELAGAIDRVLAAPPSPEVLRASVAHLDWSQVVLRLVPHELRAPRNLLRTWSDH